MKKLLFVATIAIFLFGCTSSSTKKATKTKSTETITLKNEKGTYVVLPKTATIRWEGFKIGESHYGFIKVSKGKIIVENNTFTGGEITVNVNSISVTDIEDRSYRGKLVKHLKDADFFDAEKFPEASFTFSSITVKDGNATVHGTLKIKDSILTVETPITVTESGDTLMVECEKLVFDRTKAGIIYSSGSFFDNLKDKIIKDEVLVGIKFSAVKEEK